VIFDVLATRVDLQGARVCDLFAGSGSLGFEALSRGAAFVDYVESDLDAIACIHQNALQIGCTGSIRIHAADARRFIEQTGEHYDVIFADPPYRYPHTGELPEMVFSRSLLRNGGYLLIEHAADQALPGSTLYALRTVRKFGRTVVSFFSLPSTTS
jgi:16S rRNA (guanine(966)-N(2))-methyltransferase RsmD